MNKILLGYFFFFFLFKLNAYAFDDLQNPLDFYNSTQADVVVTQEKAQSKIIKSIIFEGNIRTSNEIITNNIVLEIDKPFSSSLFEETIKNLKNMQVFSKVQIFIYEDKEKKLNIKIELSEKWTLIPYVIAGSGGGSAYYAFGLYDTNFIGRLYTFNFTYGCKNNNCSSVIFFRNPSLFGRKINYVINPALYHNVYYIYNSQREMIGSFANMQDIFISYADFKVTSGVELGGGVVYQKNAINADGLSKAEVENNNGRRFSLPASTSSSAVEGRVTLGQINYDGIMVDGVNFVSVFDSTLQSSHCADDNYSSINNTLLFYQTLPFIPYSYFALRGNISATSSRMLPLYYYLGGLDKIRGFYDGEFSGSLAWYENAELRIPSYVGDKIAIQHALFSDAGFAANSFSGIFTDQTAVSIGTGLRILFLDINKIAFRVDFAYTLNPFQTYGFSLGLLQFF